MVTPMPERTFDPQVIPYLLYADAGAAMDWLIKTFAFTERVRDKRSDGTVRHGELLLDNGGVIMLGSPGAGFRGPRELGEVTQVQCITVADVPGAPLRFRARGAQSPGLKSLNLVTHLTTSASGLREKLSPSNRLPAWRLWCKPSL
jgi:PhnB protein